MAVVDDISVKIQDAKGESTRLHIYAPTGQTFAAITAFTDQNLPLLDVITAGQIVAATLTRAIILPGGLKAAPVANSDVQEGANMLFDVAASNYNHSIRVPALVQALFTGREVDLADLDVIAWSNDVINGLGGVAPSDRKGGDLVGLLSGKKTFHK